jgi:hypothetical protein
MRNEEDLRALADIRAEVQQACDLLRAPSPAAVDRCAVAIGSAISRLREWRTQFQGHDKAANPPALEEALRLKATARRAGRLLRNAAEYHARWRQAVGAICAGYTASGAPAAAPQTGRLCLRG